MNKITIEFLDGKTKVTGAASALDVINGAATLINVLVDGMRKETEMSKGEAEERVLTMLQKALGTE